MNEHLALPTPGQPAGRIRLVDVLNGDATELRQTWAETKAAPDFEPLPRGIYVAHVHRVDLSRAKTGTPGVKLQFRVAEGEHSGRMLFHDLWLTPAALPITKRDCAKIGLTEFDQLETAAIPPGRIRCNVYVVVRTDDSGISSNRVRGFDVIGIDDAPAVDPDFPPSKPSACHEPATTSAPVAPRVIPKSSSEANSRDVDEIAVALREQLVAATAARRGGEEVTT